MRAYLLNSGRTLPEYWGTSWTKPKCLLPINDATILDYQIDRFTIMGVPIVIVVGYGANDIIKHCAEKGYRDVSFVEDRGWDKEYLLKRTLVDIKETLFMEFDDILFVHGDVLFNVDLVKSFKDASGDICKIQGRNMIHRFSPMVVKFIIKMIEQYPDVTMVNNRLWDELRRFFTITELDPYLWHTDIDRTRIHGQYRRTNQLDGFGSI